MRERMGILPELIVPALAVSFALYYLSTVWALPFQARVVGLFVGGGIFVLSAILVVRFALEVARGEKSLNFAGFWSTPAYEARRWGVLAAAVLFILGMLVVGFAVSLFLFVAVTIVVIGGPSRVTVALATATAITVIAFLVFIVATRTRFPLGAVDRAILGWIS